MLDRRWGLATGGETHLSELGLDHPERIRFYPSDWLSTLRAIGKLTVTDRDTFVDFGSGRGRVLVAAARQPFKRVVGVELSPELAAAARDNVTHDASRRRCGDVEVIVADALDFPIPRDMTVAHFFNPFTGATFGEVISRVLDSVDRHPRPLHLIYNYPVEHEQLLATRRFEVVQRLPSNWLETISDPDEAIVIYRLLPPA